MASDFIMVNDLYSYSRLFKRFFNASALLLILGLSTNARAEILIEVFADGMPKDVPQLRGTRVAFYDLSEIDRIKRAAPRFKRSPSVSVETMKKKAIAWLETKEGSEYKNALKKTVRMQRRMSDLRVMKIPAIVIDQKYVVYGTVDMAKAWREYVAHVQK